jgi:hypothetical protein
MKEERIEHYKCPDDVQKWLVLAGGTNRFGEPKFRVIWGFDRIVPITGSWEDWEETEVPDLHPLAKPGAMRKQITLKSSVVETRMVPKYLPGNCWFLECWRPPEEYGTPESWRKAGEEVNGGMTVDTAGPFPSRGEYELVMPLTDTGTYQGEPMPLSTMVVSLIVQLIRKSKEDFTPSQRKAAIEQDAARKDNEFTRVTVDRLKDSLRPYAGETSVTVL